MWDDEKISQLFQDAKRADEARVPAFERVLTRSRTASRRPRAAIFAAAAVALVLIVSVAGFFRVRAQREAEFTALEKTPAILEWQSPTDFLLETPGHELRDSLPQVGSSVNNVQAAKPQGEKQ